MRGWVDVAESVARQAHKGQVDKGKNDYIMHPAFVASCMNTDTDKAVAWLHDVVEDTFVTLEDLEAVFPAEIVQAVDAITKRPKESYSEYLKRVASNDIAYRVKLVDMKHNADISRISNPSEKDMLRCAKYIDKRIELMSMRYEEE